MRALPPHPSAVSVDRELRIPACTWAVRCSSAHHRGQGCGSAGGHWPLCSVAPPAPEGLCGAVSISESEWCYRKNYSVALAGVQQGPISSYNKHLCCSWGPGLSSGLGFDEEEVSWAPVHMGAEGQVGCRMRGHKRKPQACRVLAEGGQ